MSKPKKLSVNEDDSGETSKPSTSVEKSTAGGSNDKANMDVCVRTEMKTSIVRKGDKITVREVETITTNKKGVSPEVKVIERVKEYDVNDIPENVRAQIGGLAHPNGGTSKKVQQGSTVPASEPFENKMLSLPPATLINAADFQKLNEDSVQCHNEYRQKHGVPPLTYSKKLADYAQNWAEYLATNQKFEHRKDDNVGENLYTYYSSNASVVASPKDACLSWYNEIKSFTFGQEPKKLVAGHFTQMIWRDTKKVGTGRAKGPTGKQIIVSNYDPPGNVPGLYVANVPSPL